jgi:hypothetical protein
MFLFVKILNSILLFFNLNFPSINNS